jgi:octopine/nopaline transport system substrate-binding protein
MGPYSIGQKKAAQSPKPAGPSFMGGALGHGIAVGLRKGDEPLRRAFNQAIVEANRDGTIRKLSMKWFGGDSSPPLPQSPAP